jgi:8-amino-7-oxononanoate synthase
MRREAEAAQRALRELQHAQLLRMRRCVDTFPVTGKSTQVVVDGQTLVNFCSNDYLGLARDPRLIEALCGAARHYGAGAGAAHLVSGHTTAHHALEETLAEFTGREAALLFSTGYMANVGIVSALAERGEVVVQDKLNHASLIDGARLSDARLLRYAHGSLTGAAQCFDQQGDRASLLVTDGVFSMDGDIAPVVGLATLAKQHQAWFLVDDAHGLGVLGHRGGGVLEQYQLSADAVPLLVGTLGKAFGCFGAFVAGDRDLIELILQRARSYIYTTALPPAVAAAAREGVLIAAEESWRRERLAMLIARFRAGAVQLGLSLMPSSTPIQPLQMTGAGRCLALGNALRARGFWVSAIRAPTVPVGSERLRITLSAAHEEHEVDALLDALAQSIHSSTEGAAA